MGETMVEIVPYRHGWPTEFSEIGARLRQGLGSLALRIDHIGSTSVPGLAAKDVIDIQVTVAELSPECLEAMVRLGYSWVEDIQCDHRPALAGGEESDWSKWYFRPPAYQRPTHVHMRISGRPNQRYPLLFRDYLRSHPATAAAYANLKQQLSRYLTDRVIYTDVKDPAVDLIYLAAEEWASVTGWEMGDTDA